MKQTPQVTFAEFIQSFPIVELPVTLTEHASQTFSKENKPFSQAALEQYLIPLEAEEHDEFTEYLPCFAIPETLEFYAVVYWKAGLMNYQYILATFSKKAELIDKKVIAGTFSDGQSLIQSVATIDPEWEIVVLSGQSPASSEVHLAASKSTTQTFEILPEGQIVNI